MGHQRLGTKKHRLCEAIADKTYVACFVGGGMGHHWAVCDVTPDGRNEDMINMKTREWFPSTRDGKPTEESKLK